MRTKTVDLSQAEDNFLEVPAKVNLAHDIISFHISSLRFRANISILSSIKVKRTLNNDSGGGCSDMMMVAIMIMTTIIWVIMTTMVRIIIIMVMKIVIIIIIKMKIVMTMKAMMGINTKMRIMMIMLK